MKQWVPWTEDEIKFLKDNYKNLTRKEIADHLSRSISAISDKAHKLGITNKWTKEEIRYLEDKWGSVSIPSIAKKFNRSINAVKVKAYKLGLTSFKMSGDYVTLNQLFVSLRGKNIGSYTLNSWIKKGLPVKYRKVISQKYKVIYLDDFWKWAEQNKTLIDFSKVEENILGKELDWVKQQRKVDQLAAMYKRTPWTTAEDNRLKSMVKSYKYSYCEIARVLNRTEAAIKRRLCDLKIPDRPLKADNHIPWTVGEIAIAVKMYSQGYSFEDIAQKIPKRGAIAVRGKIERMLLNGEVKSRCGKKYA